MQKLTRSTLSSAVSAEVSGRLSMADMTLSYVMTGGDAELLIRDDAGHGVALFALSAEELGATLALAIAGEFTIPQVTDHLYRLCSGYDALPTMLRPIP